MTALLKEIALRRDYLEGEPVNTIYFGGGTPSLLSELQLANIMEALHLHFSVNPGAEITFETNPDDVNHQSPLAWKKQGVNRLSIGIQSFFEEDLVWMNRAHNALQARECITQAREAGFSNMSIDLIYGTPTLTDDKWQHNLTAAADLAIPHLSCYALTVEPGTALDIMTRTQKKENINNDDQARQFLLMTDYLQSRGYEHYEISNLALPGKRSLHNSSYWSGAKYLGLGPSAHSFNGVSRQWNVANNALYIKSLAANTVPFEWETLTAAQRQNEYVMTSVRTMEGLNIQRIDPAARPAITASCEKFISRGWMKNEQGRFVLTREGKLFADGIAADLFI